jgi:hypothetical protein
MATNNLSPLYLSDHAEEPEQADIVIALDSAVIAWRILKTGILFVTAAAIVFGVLWAGNPLVLFKNATASLVETSASPQDRISQLEPTNQSSADAQVLQPTATDAPKGGEIAPAVDVADQSQTEIRPPPAEDLLKQFQTWAAEKDARAQVEPVQPLASAQTALPVQPSEPQQAVVPVQLVEDAQAKDVQNAGAEVRHQKHRHVRTVQNARAEIRPEQNARASVPPVKNARARIRHEQNPKVQVPVQNAQAQGRPVQDAQAPWLLERLGRTY